MKRANWKRVVYAGAVVGLLIFLHSLKVVAPLESRLQAWFNPVLIHLYSTGNGLKKFYYFQTDRRDLAVVADGLRSEVNRLTEENSRLKALESENESLKKMLKFFSGEQRHYVASRVIGRSDFDQANQTILIDRGTRDGLLPGLAVVDQDGLVIGKVVDTKEVSSEVCLVTSSKCQFAAAIQNENKTIGLAKGDLGLTVKMELIPQSEVLKTGDIVVTSGLEKNIPAGLVLGKISQVVRENNELWQSARIETLSNLDSVSLASILLP
ncbi:rod shape-determining protein MreC [Candidatus Falkowbacteria bacterium]|nr:rod shape-determining protein MreC [Candidatus Falkowbacteria bacterium]